METKHQKLKTRKPPKTKFERQLVLLVTDLLPLSKGYEHLVKLLRNAEAGDIVTLNWSLHFDEECTQRLKKLL